MADTSAVVALLERGFPERPHDHFARTLARLAAHRTPAGLPKFGYVLEADSTIVGVILVIFSTLNDGEETRVRGNVASWYVEPLFRGYAAMLTSQALAHKNVTYLNISPAPHTWPILEAQGYRPLCTGQFIAVPSLRRIFGARVSSALDAHEPGSDVTLAELELLREHAAYGCSSVVCEANDRRHPFVFAKRWTKWKSVPVSYALLAYCRGVDDFVALAGPVSRYLARRGMPLVFIDANGPIDGLKGRFVRWGAKFYRGEHAPRLGDIAYTERVMFGL